MKKFENRSIFDAVTATKKLWAFLSGHFVNVKSNRSLFVVGL